jgi:beta-galactosidase
MLIATENGPAPLFAGEIHYFRIPRDAWDDRLARARRTGLNAVSTYIPWSVHEPVEGQCDFDDVLAWVEAIRRHGLHAFLRVGPVANAELTGEGVPGWLVHDPAARHRNLGADNADHYRGPSYLAPRFLEAVGRWYEALLPRIAGLQSTRGGPVVAVQLCNEIGMIPWVAKSPDRAAPTEEGYRAFLKGRYASIEALNAVHGASWRRFDEIAQPPLLIESDNWQAHLDRAAYFRAHYAEYYARLAAMARRLGIEVPLIANIPMFWDFDMRGRGLQSPLTVSLFSRFAERVPGVSLGGAYQMRRLDHENSHDIAIATEMVQSALGAADAPSRGAALCVELQTGVLCDRPRLYPSDIDLNLRLSFGHGLDGVNVYMFAGGRNADGMGGFGNYHEWQAPIASDGSTRPHLAPLESFGAFLAGFGTPFAASKKPSATAIGFHAPYWMTEFVAGGEAQALEAARDRFAFDGIWRLLDLTGRPFRVVDLDRDALPESLFVFAWDRMAAETQRRLAEHVAAGGRIAIWPRLPERDWRGEPCAILAERLGLKPERRPPRVVIIDGEERHVGSDVQTVATREGDQVLARLKDGAPAALLRSCGKGAFLYIGFGIEDKFLYWRGIFSDWCDQLGVAESIRIRPRAEIGAPWRAGADGSFLTVSNPHEIEMTASIEIPSAGAAWRDLVLPPRGAWILPHDVALGAGYRLVKANAEVQGVAIESARAVIRWRSPALGRRFRATLAAPDGRRIEFEADRDAGRGEVGLA